jgi:hypothetical protein
MYMKQTKWGITYATITIVLMFATGAAGVSSSISFSLQHSTYATATAPGFTADRQIIDNKKLVELSELVDDLAAGFVIPGVGGRTLAPMTSSGDNIYITWWSNQSGNWEVMFRVSNNSGATFADKINLSNSTDADSQNAQILATGNKVLVSWWETAKNGTNESVLRISNDNGQTFGQTLLLATNGTIGEGE